MKTKILIILLLIILIVVFAIQNTQIVIVTLFFWDIQIPKALLIFSCIAVGLILGLFIPASKKKESNNVQEAEECAENKAISEE